MTPVIFRMFDGDVIALFPTVPTDVYKWWFCESYMNVGQHGAADIQGVISSSRPCKYDADGEMEYNDLLQELWRIGYTDLKLYKKFTCGLRETLQQEHRRMSKTLGV
jgi:hypothetical protein